MAPGPNGSGASRMRILRAIDASLARLGTDRIDLYQIHMQWRERYKGFDTERNWAIVEALVAVAGELGKTPSQVALAWLLARPVVSSVIFGARTVAQLEENLGAGDLELPAAAVARLDAASAPELGDPYEFIKNIDGAW
jgi:aryl-alcohol dehydrogenase-like predicted oxidoreductase